MSLGLNTESGGDFLPFLKFDARAGRWFRKGKENEEAQIDVTDGFAAVFDLANVDVGYILFAAGAGPIYAVQHVDKGLPDKPVTEGFKQGFRLKVALAQDLGGGIYEVASTAKALIGEIDVMHSAFLAAPEAKAGKLPVYRMTGTKVIEAKSPTGVTRNYAPRMELAAWIDRPAGLTATPAVTLAPTAAQASPPSTGAQQMPPPVTKQPDARAFG